VKQATAQNPAAANCAYCRDKFFFGIDVQSLTFGTSGVAGKEYNCKELGNYRFKSWENDERMCADPDKSLAENNSTPPTVNSELVSEVWEMIAFKMYCEYPTSTPYHLQPMRTAEYSLLESSLSGIVGAYDSMTLPTNTLFTTLRTDILRFYLRKFFEAGMYRYLTQDKLHSLSVQPTAFKLGLPSGLQEFLDRTLNRILHFFHVRKCEQSESCVGWHDHGSRSYYNDREAQV